MSEKNKNNEYTPGYDDFPDFDSFDNFANFDAFSTSEPEKQDITEEKITETVTDVTENVTEETPETESTETSTSAEEVEAIPQAKEQKTKKNPLFVALCAVLVVAIALCGSLAGFNVGKYKKSVSASADAPVENVAESYNEFASMYADYGNVKYPGSIQAELQKVYAANDDVVGWLYIPDTNINTPVVQSSDNNHYLRYNFYGVYTKYGTTYADYRCKKNTLSRNTVIYGHNMPSGTHFYDVNRYEDIEWYRLHPVIKFSTLYEDYTFLVYTAFYSTVKAKDDGGYIFNYIEPNMSQSNFKGYIEQVNQRALYKTAVDLKETDKVITLSTCNHTYDQQCGKEVDSRLVVIGRLLRDGESETVDVSVAKSNANYRRPQVWYDVKGKTNPYANSRSWKASTK